MAIDKVVISATLFGQLVQNRIWFESESFQEPAEVALHIKNGWVNHIKFLQHSGLRYHTIQVTRMGEFATQQHTELLNVTGGQTPEEQNFSFVAGVMQFKTNLAGRQFRGRYFIAGIRHGDTRFNQFELQAFTDWTTQINILRDLYTGPQGGSSGLKLIIRGENVIHNTPVTQMGLRPTVGVQRRRNTGVGG